MPNLPSAKKHVRADARKRDRNRIVKSAMRSAVKDAHQSIASSAPSAQETLRRAVSLLDKAAKKGVIKKGNADRKKSRLMKQLNHFSA